MTDRFFDQKAMNRGALNRKLEAAGWGLFFIWTGIAFLTHVGWGAGLLGVGIITLGAQAARKYFDLRLERFWVVIGFLFTLSGIWELSRVQVGLALILCVIAGGSLLGSIFLKRERTSGLVDRG